MAIFLNIITIVYGVFIGSFLNVCIFRIPRGEEIAVTRSHCMTCGEQIKWYDLIPIFSFIALGGKCRNCKTKLSIQYPLVEFSNGLGYAIIVLVRGYSLTPGYDSVIYNIATVLFCLCTSALIVISVIDWRTYEIPVALNAFIGILGFIRLLTDYKHWYNYLIGFVCVSGFLFLLFIITKGRGIGGGDIKLMAAAGLLLGWKYIILALGVGCVLGSIIHITLMKIQNKERMLAFGPYLSLGIYIAMVWGDVIIDWYVNNFIR